MGSFGKKSSANKKKGPKGKKARAKARLDRQWGEVENKKEGKTFSTTQRVGKSRLKARRKASSDSIVPPEDAPTKLWNPSNHTDHRQEKKQRKHRHDDDDASISDDDSSTTHGHHDDQSDMENEVEVNPLNHLLSMIRKSKKKIKKSHVKERVSDYVDDDEVLAADDDKDNHESAPEDHDDSSNGDDDDDDSLLNDDDMSDDDERSDTEIMDDPDDRFLGRRYDRPPLTKVELESLDNPKKSVRKVVIDSNTELQVSSTPFGDMQELLNIQTNDEWQQTARETFEQTNRAVLQRQWKRVHRQRKPQGGDSQAFLHDVQAPLYSFLARYADVFVTTGSGNDQRARQTEREWHRMYLLHILNHVLISQSRISRNNKQLNDAETKQDDAREEEDADKYRDQGFTRPTVLVLLPTRGTCYAFVKTMYRLLGSEMDQEQEERFETDYGPILDEEDENTQIDLDKERRRKEVLQQKGKEWNELFGESANQDDDFKIGISLLSKTAKKRQEKSNVSVRVYADFFKSDIIIASPLGLKMIITPEEEESDVNADFLSSIEICLLQHSDVMMMQNWDHVNDILEVLNAQPENNNNTDFSRVRNYFLEGQGSYWRQLIVSSRFMDPSLISSFKRFGKSISGSVKMRKKTPSDEASISRVLLPVKQVFQKIPVASFAKQSQARVDYFLKNLLPQIRKQKQNHTMVYIPSYFDFCSLRNAFLKRDDVVFVSVTEYSRTSEVSRGRARFLQGRKPIMLYTGRAHYFHRHAIKGTQHLIFLGLPEHPEFYAEHVNLIGSVGAASKQKMEEEDTDLTATSTSCVVLFTRYEAHALERIVGSSNCSRMLGSSKVTFMFHS
jgi:U3 small nucleolar RNA-associated protein 25